MAGEIIELTDGQKTEIKVNFGTLYYLEQCGGVKLAKKMDKRKEKNFSDHESMTMAAKIIYSILRSNGQKVTFDEALELIYPDEESITKIMNAYNAEVERLKKKQKSKQDLAKTMKKSGKKRAGKNS